MRGQIRTARRLEFHGVGLLVAGAAAIAAGCHENAEDAAGEAVETVQSAIVPTQCAGATPCADVLHADDDLGRWPGGRIRYRFHPNFLTAEKTLVRRAMADWTRASGGAVAFDEELDPNAPSTTYAPIVSVENGGPVGNQFRRCSMLGGCPLVIDFNTAYHEILHTIGFPHYFQRNDKIHYFKIYQGPGLGNECVANEHWMRWPSGLNDFGPYDYFSSSSYGSPYPQMTRWNGQPLLASTNACGVVEEPPAPLCPAGNVSSIFCSTCAPGSTWLLPGDTACRSKRPQGTPTKGDGSAIAEMYRNLAEPGWQKFARTSAFLSATSPTDAAIASGVTLPATASPAVTWQPPSNFSPMTNFFVTASNSRVYLKSTPLSSGQWVDLGAPSGSGAPTDPAAVSWDSPRIDLVVARRGTSAPGNPPAPYGVHIKTSTNFGTSWTTWQSLGTPSTGATSGPAITSWGPDRLDVLVRGPNDRLYWKSCTASCNGNGGTWTGWSPVGGSETVRGRPAVVSRGSGVFDVVVQNTSGELKMMTRANGNWSSWTTISTASLPNGLPKYDSNCPACTSPAAGARWVTATDVYVRGQDDKVWLSQCTSGSCTSFVPLGGVLQSGPAAVSKSWNDGLAYLVASMPEERNAGVFVSDLWLKLYDARRFQPAQLAVYPNADGRLEVFYNGVGDVIYRKWQPSWAAGVVLPRQDPFSAAQKMAVARNQNGKLEVFYTTSSKALRHTWQYSPGSEYIASYSMDGYVVNDFAVTENADGRLQMVFTGTDDVLHSVYQVNPNDAWSADAFLNAPTNRAKRIAIARNQNDRLETFYIGTNDVIHHTTQTSSTTWNGETMLVSASTTAKRMAVVKNQAGPAAGRLEMFFIGLDDVLYRTAQTSAGGSMWTPPVPLGAPTNKAKELSAAINEDGRVEVFYLGMNDTLFHTWQNTAGGSSWFGEQVLFDAGMTGKQIAAARNADNRLEVFFVGLNDVLYHIWQVEKNSSWSAPAAL